MFRRRRRTRGQCYRCAIGPPKYHTVPDGGVFYFLGRGFVFEELNLSLELDSKSHGAGRLQPLSPTSIIAILAMVCADQAMRECQGETPVRIIGTDTDDFLHRQPLRAYVGGHRRYLSRLLASPPSDQSTQKRSKSGCPSYTKSKNAKRLAAEPRGSWRPSYTLDPTQKARARSTSRLNPAVVRRPSTITKQEWAGRAASLRFTRSLFNELKRRER